MTLQLFPTVVMNSLSDTTLPNRSITNTFINYLNSAVVANQTTSNASVELEDSLHHANFVWPEDDDLPVSFPRFYNRYDENRRLRLSALVPFGVMMVMATIIFIMIIFRRWPGLVSGIVAGSLTFTSIYLLLLTLKEEVLVFE